jgi:methionyl-tRNA formyltransferase
VSAAAERPTSPLRVLFAGTPDVALPSLEALLADERVVVVGVLTNPDRPRGRSAVPQRSSVAEFALQRNLALLQPVRPGDALEDIRALGADVGAVVAYGAILPPPVLAALPYGFVNLHFSLLPRWRGAAPVQRAIAAQDRRTGVSVFRLDAGMDTGPLLRQVEVALREDADAGDVLSELAVVGAPVLLEGLLALAGGEIPDPQAQTGVTLAPKLGAADAAIDWRLDAAALCARIRSVSPRPGAVTTWQGRRLKVAEPSVVDAVPGTGGDPGRILDVEEGVVVACGTGAVRLGRFQPEGRRWVDAEEFVNGQRVMVGELLGA